MNRDYRIFIALIFLAIFLPFLFPTIITQLTLGLVLIVLACTWDMLGGQMGYNSFGNIFFFGVGMYVCATIQIAPFTSLSDWAEAGGSAETFTAGEYVMGYLMGTLAAGLVAMLSALLLGMVLLKMRGQYFAICTLALGITGGELASGITTIGAGSGLTTPLWPSELGGTFANIISAYYVALIIFVVAFLVILWLRSTKFFLVLNAIRDNEDKAESLGIHTTRHKIANWMISAFFLGICGGLVGNTTGFIDPTEVAFAGATYGVWMVLMAIMGGKGTLWGPVFGAIFFFTVQEVSWTYMLGWQRVFLGLLIVIIVVFFPEGFFGVLKKRKAAKLANSGGEGNTA